METSHCQAVAEAQQRLENVQSEIRRSSREAIAQRERLQRELAEARTKLDGRNLNKIDDSIEHAIACDLPQPPLVPKSKHAENLHPTASRSGFDPEESLTCLKKTAVARERQLSKSGSYGVVYSSIQEVLVFNSEQYRNSG